MDIVLCLANGIDYEAGLARFMGREKVYEALLMEFLNDESYDKLKKALNDKDCKAAFDVAHTLKGVCGSLAMTELERVVSEVTEQLRAGRIESAALLMGEVDEKYKKVHNFLSNIGEEK